MVDPAHAVLIHPDLGRVGLAAGLVVIDPAHAVVLGAVAHRIDSNFALKRLNVRLLLRELLHVGLDVALVVLDARCVALDCV